MIIIIIIIIIITIKIIITIIISKLIPYFLFQSHQLQHSLPLSSMLVLMYDKLDHLYSLHYLFVPTMLSYTLLDSYGHFPCYLL